MAFSIRGTFTRPNTDTVWDMHVFFDAVVTNVLALNDLGVVTHMSGNPLTDEVLVVDHYFADDSLFAEKKEQAYNHIPAWITPENQQEALDYATENGTTVELEEVSNPNLTGYVLIELAPTPEYITPPV